MYLFNVVGGKTNYDCIVTANGEAFDASGDPCDVFFNIDIKQGEKLDVVKARLKQEELKHNIENAINLLKSNGYSVVLNQKEGGKTK